MVGGIPVRWQAVWIRPWHIGASLIPFPVDLVGFVWLSVLVGVDDEVLALHAKLRQRCDDLRPELVFGRGRVVVGVVEREPTGVADAVADQQLRVLRGVVQPIVPPSM